MIDNIFTAIPEKFKAEVFDDLLRDNNISIERIVSQGHASPETGWYDEKDNEWVLILQGSGTILFEDGREVPLQKGDYLHIPAHAKHKVSWTAPNEQTIWLAVHYSP